MHCSTRSTVAASALLILTACQRTPGEIDVCDAIHRAPELLGKPVTLSGWFSNGYHWSAVGSGDCPQKLIATQFHKHTPISFAKSEQPAADEIRKSLADGWPPRWDFQARFYGVLSRVNGPAPFSPSVEEMPYVLDVQRIEGIRIGRATWRKEPPPCDKACMDRLDQKELQSLFSDFDTNADKSISLQEWRKGALFEGAEGPVVVALEAKASIVFKAVDTDSDGRLTMAEFAVLNQKYLQVPAPELTANLRSLE